MSIPCPGVAICPPSAFLALVCHLVPVNPIFSNAPLFCKRTKQLKFDFGLNTILKGQCKISS